VVKHSAVLFVDTFRVVLSSHKDI